MTPRPILIHPDPRLRKVVPAVETVDEDVRKLAEDMGNNIIDLTPEQVAEWKDAASGTEAKWIEEMDGKGFDGQALVDQAKSLIEENTTE